MFFSKLISVCEFKEFILLEGSFRFKILPPCYLKLLEFLIKVITTINTPQQTVNRKDFCNNLLLFLLIPDAFLVLQ